MGKVLKAECACGYENSVLVGSGREQHGQVYEFPHYCANCNEAVSVDLLGQKVTCPLCHGTALTIYGTQKRRIMQKKPWFQTLFGGKADRELPTVVSDYCYNLDTTFEIEKGGHFCPKCKEQRLHFSLEWMID